MTRRAATRRTGGVAGGRGWRATAAAYVALTKPRIIELLLVTTVPAMVLAQRGIPPLGLVAATLLGGTLAAGSAHAVNQVLERDIDALMHRTSHRPVPATVVSPRAALVYGVALLVASVVVMLAWVNPLAAALTVAANAFYLLVYTVLLKRRTSQNIVWGGIAGCMPTLVGWAAVTGSLAWPPFVLFLVVFFWTPPHYWPLAIRFRADYARAGVPMLPVVAGDEAVARQVVAYSWAMVACSIALWPVAGTGWLYPVVAVVAGAWFLAEAHRMLSRARRGASATELAPMRLFHGSITYLTAVFLAVVVDVLLLG
ncbi:MAG TPA: heme o synthase [Jiangellales bacterium]|nr:heme o synthase [Jiangellales bacterium]